MHDDVFKQYFLDSECSLEYFLTEVDHPKIRNSYVNYYLHGLKLDDIWFVGFLEHFTEDVAALQKLLNLNVIESPKENVGKYKKKSARAILSEEVIEKFKELNKEDYEFYEKALEERKKRIDLFGAWTSDALDIETGVDQSMLYDQNLERNRNHISLQENAIERQKKAMEKQKGAIEQQKIAISKLKDVIDGKQARIAEIMDIYSGKQDVIRKKDETLKGVRANLRDLSAHLQAARADAYSAEGQLRQTQSKIDTMSNSKFWKARGLYLHYKEGMSSGLRNPHLFLLFVKKRVRKLWRVLSRKIFGLRYKNLPLNDKELYLSLHVPKTAGTTLRILLQRKFRKNIYLDYEYEEDKSDGLTQSIDAIHTHNPFVDYKDLHPNIKIIIFLREPLSRAISHYFYWKKIKAAGIDLHYHGPIFDEYFVKREASLEEFLIDSPDWLRNIYTDGYLAQANIDDIWFVGFQEHFDDDLQRLATIFKMSEKDSTIISENVNRAKSPIEVSQKVKDEFYRKNFKDKVFYDKMLRERNRSRELPKENL
ncbi:sulfotransferase family 2 domain-containing protein [Pseudomonadota bacterium]